MHMGVKSMQIQNTFFHIGAHLYRRAVCRQHLDMHGNKASEGDHEGKVDDDGYEDGRGTATIKVLP